MRSILLVSCMLFGLNCSRPPANDVATGLCKIDPNAQMEILALGARSDTARVSSLSQYESQGCDTWVYSCSANKITGVCGPYRQTWTLDQMINDAYAVTLQVTVNGMSIAIDKLLLSPELDRDARVSCGGTKYILPGIPDPRQYEKRWPCCWFA